MGFFGNEQKELIQMIYGSGSEDHLLLLDSLGDFIEKEIEPTAREIDVNAQFPRENITKMFEQGFTSMGFPKEYGGLEPKNTEALSFHGLSTSRRWKWSARRVQALPSHSRFMEPAAKEYDSSVIQNRRCSSFPE